MRRREGRKAFNEEGYRVRKVIKALYPILLNKNLTNKTKINIFKITIKPVMMYSLKVCVLEYSARIKFCRNDVLEEMM